MANLVILVSGISLVCELEEILGNPGEPDCRIINPYEIVSGDEDLTLKKWPAYTNKTDIELRSDNILTIVDPTKEILVKYLELTAE